MPQLITQDHESALRIVWPRSKMPIESGAREGAISENGTWDELCQHGYLAEMLSKGR